MTKYLVNLSETEDAETGLQHVLDYAQGLPMRWEFCTGMRLVDNQLVSYASCQIYVKPKETQRWCKLCMPMVEDDYPTLFKTLGELFKDWKDWE